MFSISVFLRGMAPERSWKVERNVSEREPFTALASHVNHAHMLDSSVRPKIKVFTFHGAGTLKTRENSVTLQWKAGARLGARPSVLSPVPQQAHRSCSSPSETKFACGHLFLHHPMHHRIDPGDDLWIIKHLAQQQSTPGVAKIKCTMHTSQKNKVTRTRVARAHLSRPSSSDAPTKPAKGCRNSPRAQLSTPCQRQVPLRLGEIALHAFHLGPALQ